MKLTITNPLNGSYFKFEFGLELAPFEHVWQGNRVDSYSYFRLYNVRGSAYLYRNTLYLPSDGGRRTTSTRRGCNHTDRTDMAARRSHLALANMAATAMLHLNGGDLTSIDWKPLKKSWALDAIKPPA